ncbi:MAG: hypothetical protein RJA76_1300 [Bacteroidota bacterium]|jgi:glycosyltransferase involved in cell wall biosynthesis
MNIGFDAKRLFLNKTGLGNYSRFVVDSLLSYYPNNQYFLYTPKTKSHKGTSQYFEGKNIHIIKPKGIFKFPFFNSIWRSLFMANDPSVENLDIFHGLSHELPVGLPKHVKKIVTVHDLIFLRFPKLFNPIDVWIYKKKLQSACQKADVIVAISEQTKNDIMTFFGIDENKIKVIYQGCNKIYFDKVSDDKKKDIKTKYQLPDNFILNVGSIEERKNVGLLVEAISKIKQDIRPHVVLIGKRTAYTNKVEELVRKYKLEEYVVILPYISFDDLSGIYQQAQLFAYTSIIEGFGIPILEAMVSEIPALVPNGSCFHEVVGPNGMYYEQGNSDDLANKIKKLLSDDNSKLIVNQNNYLQRFFEDSIQKLYREVYCK